MTRPPSVESEHPRRSRFQLRCEIEQLRLELETAIRINAELRAKVDPLDPHNDRREAVRVVLSGVFGGAVSCVVGYGWAKGWWGV